MSIPLIVCLLASLICISLLFALVNKTVRKNSSDAYVLLIGIIIFGIIAFFTGKHSYFAHVRSKPFESEYEKYYQMFSRSCDKTLDASKMVGLKRKLVVFETDKKGKTVTYDMRLNTRISDRILAITPNEIKTLLFSVYGEEVLGSYSNGDKCSREIIKMYFLDAASNKCYSETFKGKGQCPDNIGKRESYKARLSVYPNEITEWLTNRVH